MGASAKGRNYLPGRAKITMRGKQMIAETWPYVLVAFAVLLLLHDISKQLGRIADNLEDRNSH